MVKKEKISKEEKRALELKKGLENIIENKIRELEGTMIKFEKNYGIKIRNTEAYQKLMNQYNELEKSVKGCIQDKYNPEGL